MPEPYEPIPLPTLNDLRARAFSHGLDCSACGYLVNAVEVAQDEVERLRDELASVREDAERWKHVLNHHCRSGSPHMDNTWVYRFAGALRGRWETPEQAVDAARRAANGL